MCPRCGSNAPVVYRGMLAYCTACGAQRAPLLHPSVNLAGQPSKVGGTVARVGGTVVLAGGLSLALMLGLMFVWLFPGTIAGVAVGLPIAIFSLVMGLLLRSGGKSLHESGASKEREAQLQAIYAFAAHRGGVVRAAEVAGALGVTAERADAILTDLAKTQSDKIALEIDDVGGVYFRLAHAAGAPVASAWPDPARVRVDPGAQGASPHTRVAPQPGVIDTELVEDEGAPAARRQRR